jgi:hypothetical protein
MPGLKDVGGDLAVVADELNDRPGDILDLDGFPRELGYFGLVSPKFLARCGGGIRSRDIVIAPFGAAVIPITVSTRDIFAIGILGFRGVALLLRSIHAPSRPRSSPTLRYR